MVMIGGLFGVPARYSYFMNRITINAYVISTNSSSDANKTKSLL